MSDSNQSQFPEFAPSPEYIAREKRVTDALALKKPDRIPLLLMPGELMADMGGVTRLELYENYDKTQRILEKLAKRQEIHTENLQSTEENHNFEIALQLLISKKEVLKEEDQAGMTVYKLVA